MFFFILKDSKYLIIKKKSNTCYLLSKRHPKWFELGSDSTGIFLVKWKSWFALCILSFCLFYIYTYCLSENYCLFLYLLWSLSQILHLWVKHSLCKRALFSFLENTLLFLLLFQIHINLKKQFHNDSYL